MSSVILELKHLYSEYSWLLSVPEQHSEYLEPGYYDRLLKDYSFGGITDLELLNHHLIRSEPSNNSSKFLELGCGSGRATDTILQRTKPNDSIDLIDLSSGMVNHCQRKYAGRPQVQTCQMDSIEYLSSTRKTYDSVVSLWAFSHSIHQHLQKAGREQGEVIVRKGLERLIKEVVNPNGSIFIMHYDIQSPEQKLINPWRLLLWKDADPNYDATGQAPSKEILDSVLSEAKDRGLVDYECIHHQGDPITYDSPERALETFINFHMEGVFNTHPDLPRIIGNLEVGIAAHTNSDGLVSIAPGCFTYRITRL